MRVRRLSLAVLGIVALAGLAVPVGAQPAGSEFQVNTYTTANQETRTAGGSHVIVGADGRFVVVWSSFGQDGSGHGIFGQRFDSAAGKLGSEFRVSSYTTQTQFGPSVAADAGGNFVVAWWSFGQDGDRDGVFAQRYDSEGVARGGEFRVNSYTTSSQFNPSIGSDANGNFVVVWESRGQYAFASVVGQRYDSSGAPQGGEFRIDSDGGSIPAVASDASGNFVVAWDKADGSSSGVFARRFDSGGAPQGVEFRVNSYTTDRQRSASVASDASGNFVIVWESLRQDGDRDGVFAQRYDSDGVPLGGEFRVNSYTTLNQYFASVASEASGSFVVAWRSPAQGGIRGKRYDGAGVPQGDEFQVDSYTLSSQHHPSVGATGLGQFVVVWDSGQDGSDDGVFGRRYDFAGGTITVVRPNTNLKWAIGSVKEIRWTHDVGADATFRIELDRNDDGTFEELIAADAPADSATTGRFAWTVTGPPTGRARVRVSWTDDLAVSDASDVTFRIKLEG
jgi:hypothetical protein